MAGFLSTLKGMYQAQMERHHNQPFLKATMAACAMVATADGNVSFSEQVRVDQILQTLDALKIYDPHEGVNLFREYSEAILEDPKVGHRKAAKAIDAVKGDPERSALMIRICLAVAESNGETKLVDQIEVVTLCSILGVDPTGFDLYDKDLLFKDKEG